MNDSLKPIVIAGGGFTGLFTALHLSNQKCSRPIILIDCKWRFLFQPLLYEILTGEINLDVASLRYDELLAGSDIMFVHNSISHIDLKQRKVSLDSGLCYNYEYLVLSLGRAIGYFNIPGARENTFTFRTGEDVLRLGQHLRTCLQRATQEKDPLEKKKLLTVAIIGTGSVGVELAATLAHLLPVWYEALQGDAQELQIEIIQRGEEILKGDTNELLHPVTETSLHQRTTSIKMILNANISAVGKDTVKYERIGNTENLEAATIVWTAETVAHPLIRQLAISEKYRDRKGKIIINNYFELPEYPEVFAGGDCAVKTENPQPALTQVANQKAEAIATNVKALCEGKELSPVKVSLRDTSLIQEFFHNY